MGQGWGTLGYGYDGSVELNALESEYIHYGDVISMAFGFGGFGLFPYYSQYPIQPYFQPYVQPYYRPFIQPYYPPCNLMIPLPTWSCVYPFYSMPYRVLAPLIESELL